MYCTDSREAVYVAVIGSSIGTVSCASTESRLVHTYMSRRSGNFLLTVVPRGCTAPDVRFEEFRRARGKQ